MDTYLVLEYWPFVMRDLADSSNSTYAFLTYVSFKMLGKISLHW